MMKSTLLAAASIVVIAGSGAAYGQVSVPDDAEPLGAAELEELYSDRTWQWEDGAAYFAPDGDFKAVNTGESWQSYATGSWETRSGGRVCFRGVWHSSEDTRDLTHCFEHVEADGTTYQRELPGRPWTVFRSPEENADQEYARFEEGDQVTSELSSLRSALEDTQ